MRRRWRRRIRLTGFTLALWLLGAAAGGAQTAGTGVGVEITPNKFEYDLAGKQVSVKILVVNHEDSARRIRLSVAGLGHDLDGAPQFLEPAAASGALRLSVRGVTLPAGGRREVILSGAIPRDAVSLYAAVVAEFTRLEQARASTVEVRSRVASLFLLRGPRPWRETVEVVGVGILPGAAGRPLRVYAAVKDTGNVHVRPTGRVRILKDGILIDTVRLSRETILPGFARRLTGLWTPPAGLTGHLTLEALIENPTARGIGVVDLTGGSAAQPAAKIGSLRARDEGGPLVSLVVTNTGDVPIAPAVTLFASGGEVERARQILVQPTMAPGQSREVEWRPTLADGVYLVTAQVSLGDLLLDQDVTGLEVGGAAPGRTLLIILAVVLLSSVLSLWLLAVRRRRRQEGAGAQVRQFPVRHPPIDAARRPSYPRRRASA